MSDFGFDVKEVMVRIFKYVFEGLVVSLAAYAIPGKKLDASEILTIALVAAATLAILDLFLPAVSGSARAGVGFGIGANLVGFPAGGAPRV
jgi:ABC-type Co2+ transport system permease subunit